MKREASSFSFLFIMTIRPDNKYNIIDDSNSFFLKSASGKALIVESFRVERPDWEYNIIVNIGRKYSKVVLHGLNEMEFAGKRLSYILRKYQTEFKIVKITPSYFSNPCAEIALGESNPCVLGSDIDLPIIKIKTKSIINENLLLIL